VAGVHRGGLRILNPSASETLLDGDEILLLGTPVQNQEFKSWRSNGGDTAPAGS